MKRWRAVLGRLGLVVAFGCDVPPPATGEDAMVPHRPPGASNRIEIVQVQIQPTQAGAETYGAPVLHRSNPGEKAIHAELRGIKAVHEPALSRMARELATTTPDRLNIPPALVDELMAWNGLVHPPPGLTVVELGPDAPDCVRTTKPVCRGSIESLVEEVRASLPEADEVAYGVGAAGLESGASRFVVALLEPAVRMESVPKRVGQGREVKVGGRLLGGRSQPSVEVVDPDGVWTTVPTLTGDDNMFSAVVRCQKQGAYQVELLVEGEHGPEVAANFPLYCASSPPLVLDVELERVGPGVTADQIARVNFDYLNVERTQRGLPALSWDRKASKVALAHSRDMYRSGFVGHRSPTTGDVTERFKRARMRGTVIRENVARGYGPKQIHQSFMRSPGHRVNMLASDVTHVGIGVVVGKAESDASAARRSLFATQNFFRDPEAAAAAQGDPVMALRKRVDAARKAGGMSPVTWHEKLGRVAAKQARAMARGRKPGLDQSLERDLADTGFSSIDRHHVESNDVSGFDELDLWKDTTVGAVGLGVAERKSRGGTTYVLLILVAR